MKSLLPHCRRPRRLRVVCFAAAASLLSACASVSPDAAMRPVREHAAQVLGPTLGQALPDGSTPLPPLATESTAAAPNPRVQALLAADLSADSAVELALRLQPGLQARLQSLALADAERTLAHQWPNPLLGIKHGRSGEASEWELGLHFALGSLLQWPRRAAQADAQLQAEQREATLAVLAHAAEVRRAWVRAVAAQAAARELDDARRASEAGAELARQLQANGSQSAWQAAREASLAAEAALQWRLAQQAETRARESLVRLIGLPEGPGALRLPTRLPPLPAAAPAPEPSLETQALASRLDLQAAAWRLNHLGLALGAAPSAGFVDALSLGLTRTTSAGSATQRSAELLLPLPLFDWGGGRLALAQAQYRQQLLQTAQATLEARSQVREAAKVWQGRWALAKHHADVALPLAQRIAQEDLLRYNGMLIGVFDLLASGRARVAASLAELQARRDYWLAEADLQQVLHGPLQATATDTPRGTALNAATATGGH